MGRILHTHGKIKKLSYEYQFQSRVIVKVRDRSGRYRSRCIFGRLIITVIGESCLSRISYDLNALEATKLLLVTLWPILKGYYGLFELFI